MIIPITFFIFALIIGVAVIGRVPATLHTPLMSGANSIHGVVLVGVIVVAADSNSMLGNLLIFFAALLGTLNVVGGYVVTDRMLEMFKPKQVPAQEAELQANFGQEYLADSNAVEVTVTETEIAPVDWKNDPVLARSVLLESGDAAVKNGTTDVVPNNALGSGTSEDVPNNAPVSGVSIDASAGATVETAKEEAK